MSEARPSSALSGPGMMLLSAAIFGYFGWMAGLQWSMPGQGGTPVFFRVLLGWTLRGSAIAFVLAAGLTVPAPRLGNLIYSVAGLLGALLLVVVVVLDTMDPQHAGLSPILLLLFAVWNGFGSWVGLRAVLAGRGAGPGEASAPPHDRTIW